MGVCVRWALERMMMMMGMGGVGEVRMGRMRNILESKSELLDSGFGS